MARNTPPATVTRDEPPLVFRGAVESVDAERRTFGVVFQTGQRMLRGGFFSEPYYLELSMEPKHVRLDFLNSGRAPLLNSHKESLEGVIGVVEAGSAKVSGGKAMATVRFASADVDPNADLIFRKVKDGLVRNISVGARLHKLEEISEEGKYRVFRATDWEPFEVSPAAIGADQGAQVMSANAARAGTNPCEYVTCSTHEERTMDPTNNDGNDPGGTPPVAAAAPPPVDQMAIRRAEKARSILIRERVRLSKLPDGEALAAKWIADDVSLEDASKMIFEKLAAAAEAMPTVQHTRVDVVDNGRDTMRAGMLNALLHRTKPEWFALDDNGKRFRGRPALDMARMSLEAQGFRDHGTSRDDLAAYALGLERFAGQQSTSDFPLLLGDAAGKLMRRAYEAAPASYIPLVTFATAPDFKDVKRLQLGENPALAKVVEGAEYTYGTIGEGREVYALATFGKILAFSRRLLINDDLNAFARVIPGWGNSVRQLESDLAWAQITANGNMADGVALFHATHANLAAGGDAAVISIASIGKAREKMRLQKGLDAKTVLNIFPEFLAVPVALETVAQQFVASTFVPGKSSDINPFAGRLTVIAEARLDANSVTKWYAVASPSQVEGIEILHLEGAEAPRLTSRESFERDGMEFKCSFDVASKILDHRPWFRNDGA